MQIPSFVGPSYTLGSGYVSAQRAVNFYPELAEAAAKNAEQYHYVRTPGLRLLATLAGGEIRGMWTASNGRAFAVAGANLYEIIRLVLLGQANVLDTVAGEPNLPAIRFLGSALPPGVDSGDICQIVVHGVEHPVRGTHAASFPGVGRVFYFDVDDVSDIAPGAVATLSGMGDSAQVAGTLIGTMDEVCSAPAYMSDNGNQLMIVNGLTGYLLDFATNALTRIAQDAWLGAGSVSFIDGYFVVTQPNSRQFFISGIYDGTSWDPADVGAKSTQPDMLLVAVESFERLCLIGATSSETWVNNGDVNFPFQREQEIEIGTAAAATVKKLSGYPIFLATDRDGQLTVMHFYGFQPRRVSTHAVEQAIAQCNDIANATAWTYERAGHGFYVLNLPGAKASWVYDSSTTLWHERVSNDAQRGESRHRAQHHCYANGMHIVGDYENGNLYELTPAAFDDAGTPLVSTRRFPHSAQQGVRLFFARLQIDIESGVGLDGAGTGTDPQIGLRWSDDGARSWSKWRNVSIGKIGETKARAIWRRLGSSRQRVFEVAVSDPVPVTLVSAWLDATAGAS